jgi:hypothetical protein
MSWARRQARHRAPVRLPGAAGSGCRRPAGATGVERDLHQLVATLRAAGLMGEMCRGIRHGTLCVLVFAAVGEALAFLRVATDGETPCEGWRAITAVARTGASTSTRTAVLLPAADIAAVRARVAAATS